MSALQTSPLGLASYLPRFHVRRLGASSAGAPRSEQLEGAMLFADLSGFTRLTEEFAKRGPAGAEQLSEVLNRFFGRMTEVVTAHAGDLVTFAGDAAWVLWPAGQVGGLERATHLAAHCALTIQRELGGISPLPGVELRIRAAVSAGEVTIAEVGGVNGRWDALLLGDALVQVTAADREGSPGEVIVSSRAASMLGDRAHLSPVRGGNARLHDVVSVGEVEAVQMDSVPTAAEEKLAALVPKAVAERLRAGQLDWLAEFRTAAVVFVNLPGLEVPTPEHLDRLQTAAREMQATVASLDGGIYQFLADDKGATLVAAFGIPPHAHGDDAARAVMAALEIRRRLDARGIATAIGVSTGRVFSGTVGSALRSQYLIRGSVVNLAARLMMASARGVICDSTTARAAAGKVEFEQLPAVRVKGRDEPVPVLRPRGLADRHASAALPLVGRTAERERITARLAELSLDRAWTIVVTGEPGMGKSHLLGAMAGLAGELGVTAVSSAADAIERATPYFLWRALLPHILLPREETPTADRLAGALRSIFAGDDALLAWLPLLEVIAPIGLAGTELTGQMDSASRAAAVEELVVRLLQARAVERPMVLVVDDLQWVDSSSLALLRAVAKRVRKVGVLAGSRPLDEDGHAELIAYANGATERFTLSGLSDVDVLAVVAARLGVRELPAPARELIRTRAEGHPFYAEELGLALRDAGLLVVEGDRCRMAREEIDLAEVGFPQSLEGVITGRIDRLTPRQQLALKTASVIGRIFALPVLRDVYPVREEQAEIPAVLDNLERLDVTRLHSLDPELAYLFKHVTTHEVTYNLLLFSQRRLLHRQIAEWYERAHAADLSADYPLLAHHWTRAEDPAKALEYLEKAAESALHSFANREVVGFVRRAYELAERSPELASTARRAKWERMLAEARVRMADYDGAEPHLRGALALAGRPLPASKGGMSLELGLQIARQIGHRLAPKVFLKTDASDVDRFASSLHHSRAEIAFFTHDMLGLLHATFSSLNYGERAGATRETVNGYGSLAHVTSLAGLRKAARAYRARSLELAERDGSLATIAFAHQIAATFGNCVGDWEDVKGSCLRAMELFSQLGDRFRHETCACIYGYNRLSVGALDDAVKAWDDAYASAHPDGAAQVLVWSRTGVLLVQLARGTVDPALVEEVERLTQREIVFAERVLAFGALAAAHFWLGDRARAVDAAERGYDAIAAQAPSTSYTMWSIGLTADTLLAAEVGHPRAKELHAKAKKIIKAFGPFALTMPAGAPRAALSRGALAVRDGEQRAAKKHFEAARSSAEKLGMPWELAAAHRALAALAKLGSKKTSGAEEHEAAALRQLEPMGAARGFTMAWLAGRGERG